jgi:hypothetical protein
VVTRVRSGPPKKINMGADPKCAALHPEPPTSEELVVNASGQVRWAFVYVKAGLEERTFKVPEQAAVIDQVGCLYVPHVLGLQPGQKLRIVNQDELLHNIHALPFLNPGFNVGQPQKGMASEQEFRDPEIMIRVKCDVHPWMGAWVGVLNHPFFAVTDSEGAYQIEGVPPGRYTIAVWHERLALVDRPCEIKAGEELKLDFTLDARP